jgi:hypothetical protein
MPTIELEQLQRFMQESGVQEDLSEMLESWQISREAMGVFMATFVGQSVEEHVLRGTPLHAVIATAFWCGLEIGYKSALEVVMETDKTKE